MEPIDAVIMWVDGEDEIFGRQYANYSGTVPKARRRHESAGRYRNTGELFYCLRGIERHMPWIRKIFIVTSGQVPAGLDFDNDRLNLVIHSDIFPDLNALPTFNSFAIDSCLHNIPGLSEKFIRFSDDFLAINDVPREALMGQDGNGKFYFGGPVPNIMAGETARTNYLSTLAFNRYVLGTRGIMATHVTLHAPQMRSVTVCRKIDQDYANDLAITRGSKFRTDRCLSMLFFYPHFMSKRLGAPLSPENKHTGDAFSYSTWGIARQALVGDDRKDWRQVIRRAKSDGALFLNVNDHLGSDPDNRDMEDFESLMAELFPAPAAFEAAA